MKKYWHILTPVFVIMLILQAVYVRYTSVPSSVKMRGALAKLGTPGEPETQALQKQLRSWGPAIIPEIETFVSQIEAPVQKARSDQRVSALQILGSFPENPAAVELLVKLARTPDGLMRKEVINQLGIQWGNGVLEALEAIIFDGEVTLKIEPDTTVTDFDRAAAEALGRMFILYGSSQPERALAVQQVLERAVKAERVKDKIESLLATVK